YRLINPGGPGWRKYLERVEKEESGLKGIVLTGQEKWDVPGSLLLVFLGCLSIYAALFSIGFWIYANYVAAVIGTLTAIVSGIGLFMSWGRLKMRSIRKPCANWEHPG
ncbi:MAG TPA: hypothetical protein VK186_25840, partial [Candidatus Deferrimicrobium sp.]|nr:hypothetical protein [Candidatus Deferrimicrobium sp.]